MKGPIPQTRRAEVLSHSADTLESVQDQLLRTGWVQEREDFAAILDTLIDRLRAEGRASKRLSRK